MAVSLKHAFQSAKPDGADTSIVRPSDWNAEHVLTQASGKLLGRTSAGTGATEEITAGSGLALSAGTLTADVTSVAGRTGAVTLAVADVSGAAPTASPALTGTPTAPTAASGTNTTQIATTAYVQGEGYLKAATATSTYAPLASPTFTGTVTLPSTTSIGNVSATELSYVDGVTSAIQTQIDGKAATVHTHDLSALNQSGATTGQVVTWSGSAWIAQTPTTGVSSFNTRTGAVTLSSSDVTTALTYTPVNKAGDTMSGTLNLPSNGLTVGTNQLVVSSGNIGVGLTAPVRQISVSSATQSNIQLTNTAAGATITDGFQFQFDGSFNYIWGYENIPTVFGTNNAERMRIDASGGVSIGTTSSGGYKLRVDGTTGAYVSTVNNTAIYGYASGSGQGVYGQSVSGVGVYALSSSNYAVYAQSTSNYAAYFSATNNHGILSYGLYYGAWGQTTASSYGGVIGYSQNGSYYGINGYANYYSFYGNGNASITNGTWGTSDIRFKEIVDENPFAIGGPYDRSALDIVSSIPVRAYRLKGPMADTSINGVDQFGWIAQEVEAILPLAVTETPIPPNDIKTRAWIAEIPVPDPDSDDEKELKERNDLVYKSLNKDYLIAALWGAVQELKQEITLIKSNLNNNVGG